MYAVPLLTSRSVNLWWEQGEKGDFRPEEQGPLISSIVFFAFDFIFGRDYCNLLGATPIISSAIAIGLYGVE